MADITTVEGLRVLSEDQIIGMLTDMARALPDVISAAHIQARTDGLSERVLGPLAQHLIAHASKRLASITAARSSRPVLHRHPP